MILRKIYDKEYQLCMIIWENEPITTSELVFLSNDRLRWANTTTYTVIKRLIDKGIIKKDGHIITTLLSKEQIQDARTEELLKKTFGGCLADLLISISRLISRCCV